MAFTLFKEEYKKRMDDGVLFNNIDETAEFITDLYHESVKDGLSGNGGKFVLGNKKKLRDELKKGLSSKIPSLLFFEAQLSLGLIGYWTGGTLNNGSTITSPGVPVKPRTFSNADTIDDFLDNCEKAFTTHLKGTAGLLGNTAWTGYNVP